MPLCRKGYAYEATNSGKRYQKVYDTVPGRDESDAAFKKRRAFFEGLIRIINLLPNSFQIAKKWNEGDHAKRVEDHSITYDYFNVTEDSVTYRVSKCMYVEMFETYGIRELCKIYCNTDTRSYNGLTRHVKFIRHSDLSDGPCCWDEVHRK